MSSRSRVEFSICTARRGKRGQNMCGAELTTDGVDTITRAFIHRYINRKICEEIFFKHPNRKKPKNMV